MEFKIGADPEFFLRDRSTGKFVSAHGIIPGTKRQPMKVECGAVQVDGMALEFNIDPVTNVEDWNRNITTVLTQLREMVDPQLEFVFTPVADFGKEYIDSQPDVAKELGCEPDYNAYTGAINPKPNSDLGFRTASGHVHIGWTDQQDITDPEHIEACHMLVKQLDVMLAFPAVGWDQDDVRQSMYGALGAYRPKHYGVEYRVLSNAWLDDPRAQEYVFNQTMHAATSLMKSYRVYESFGGNISKFFQEEMQLAQVAANVRYHNSHANDLDFSWIKGKFESLINKGWERPAIKERFDKMTNELYMAHKVTRELVSYETALLDPKSYNHFDEYVTECLRKGLEKPESVTDAQVKYLEAVSRPNKEKVPKELTWTPMSPMFSVSSDAILESLVQELSTN